MQRCWFQWVNNIKDSDVQTWVLIPIPANNDDDDDDDDDDDERAKENDHRPIVVDDVQEEGCVVTRWRRRRRGIILDPNVTPAPSPSNNSSLVLELRSFDGGDEGRETAFQIDNSGAC
jgi:hypothetical protein